jgi:hypothetical protein
MSFRCGPVSSVPGGAGSPTNALLNKAFRLGLVVVAPTFGATLLRPFVITCLAIHVAIAVASLAHRFVLSLFEQAYSSSKLSLSRSRNACSRSSSWNDLTIRPSWSTTVANTWPKDRCISTLYCFTLPFHLLEVLASHCAGCVSVVCCQTVGNTSGIGNT